MRRILQTTLKNKTKFFTPKTKFYSSKSTLSQDVILKEYKKLDEMRQELNDPNLSEAEKKEKKLDILQFEVLFRSLLNRPLDDLKLDEFVTTEENPNLGGKKKKNFFFKLIFERYF